MFSVYAPQLGRSVAEKDDFWGNLDDEVSKVTATEELFIAGDINGHVGRSRRGFEEVMGPHGFGN